MNRSQPNDKMNQPPFTLDEPSQEDQPNSKQTKGRPNLSLYDIVRLTFASLIGLFLLIPISSHIGSKNEIDITVISMTAIVVFYFLRRSSDSEQAIGRSPNMSPYDIVRLIFAAVTSLALLKPIALDLISRNSVDIIVIAITMLIGYYLLKCSSKYMSPYDIVGLSFASLIGLFLLIPISSDIASKNEIDMTVISMTIIIVFYFLKQSDSEQAIRRSPNMSPYDIVRLIFAAVTSLALLKPILLALISKDSIDITVIAMTMLIGYYLLKRSSNQKRIGL